MKKSDKNITIIIAAKNEEKKIDKCLKSVNWASQTILVDTLSTDNTKKIAKGLGAEVYDYEKGSYSDWKNYGATKAKGDWILFMDADERVTEKLKAEILSIIGNREKGVYAIPRRNVIFGREFKHGGLWPDYVIRLFKKDRFIKWAGVLHEQPKFMGELGYLDNPLVHHKHDNLEEMVEKTNNWSAIEAELLYKNGHPRMAWWRFARIMLTEAWKRFFQQLGFLDGPEGVIYSSYQVWSRFITYAKLWELQLHNNKSNIKN
jgi:glycosyltransferase involved in cell wall biosynthesis